MWGAIIGAAISAVSSIAGSAASSAAARKAKATAEAKERQRQAENQAWYDRRYNEDPLQRASAQRVLTKTAELIKERNKAAQGRAAVMGGTEESVAATKEANANAMAEAASNIAAAGEARKDAIEARYLNTKQASEDALAKSQEQYELNRAENIGRAIQGVGSAAGSIIGAAASGSTTGGNSGRSAKEYRDVKPVIDSVSDSADNMTIGQDKWDKFYNTVDAGTTTAGKMANGGSVTPIIDEEYLKRHPYY